MKKFYKIDWLLMVCTVLLLSMGLFTLFSLTSTQLEGSLSYLQKEFTSQLTFAFIGSVFFLLIFLLPFTYFKMKPILFFIYLLTIGLLVYTIFFGLDVKGVRRWISFGGTVLENGTIAGGFTLQASEFAKITMIIITSYLLSLPISAMEKKEVFVKKIKHFLLDNKNFFLMILINLSIVAAILAQKSLSVAIVVIGIVAAIIFASVKVKFTSILIVISFAASILLSQNIFLDLSLQTRALIFLIPAGAYVYAVYSEKVNEIAIFSAIAIGLIFGAILLNLTWTYVLKDYQKARIETYFNPNANTEEEGFQQDQSKISIGAGQLFGQGFRQTTDSRLLLLPEPTTDFIFAIFSFKFGFVGAIMMITLFLILIGRLIYLADEMNDKYSSLLLIGTAAMILIQFFSNIGMNLGILPVGGTTLPLISAGGSSLISTLMLLGLCQNVIATNRMEKTIHQRKDKVVIEGWNS